MNRSTLDSFVTLRLLLMRLLFMRKLSCILSVLVGLSGCASSVNDYLVEARRGDPESVTEAVVNVGKLLREKEGRGVTFDRGDEEAVKYLTEVAEIGKNAVNRASAIDSLSHLRRPRLTSLFLRRLEDKSWGVQLEAARALSRNPDPEALPALTKRLDDEIRIEVRLEIVKALAAVGGEEALRTLLDALLYPSGRYGEIRLTVFDSVRQLSGKDFGLAELERWSRYKSERFPVPKPTDSGVLSTSGNEKNEPPIKTYPEKK